MMQRLKGRSRADDRKTLELQLNNLAAREDQLTDALLDGLIDKIVFNERKVRLADQRRALTEALAKVGDVTADERLARNFLELAKSVHLTYQIADTQKKRRLTEILFSNRTAFGKNLCLTTHKWLADKAWAMSVLCGPPDRDRTRIKEEISNVCREVLSKSDPIPEKCKQAPGVAQ